MSRYEVLKYSGCLRRTLIRLLIVLISTVGMIMAKTIEEDLIRTTCFLISASFLVAFTLIIISDLLLLFKIVTKKYEIVTKEVKAFAKRRPFDTFDNHYKAIVFKDFQLVVEQQFADGIKMGDLITMVFANGIKYPIVVIKRDLD